MDAPFDVLDRLAAVPADRPALVSGNRELTFGELRAEVARVALGLTERGIGEESLVALSLPRGADLVVALFGIMAAGAAYLPVDPDLPVERRRYLIEDADAELVIVDGAAVAVTASVSHIAFADLARGAEAAFEPVPVVGDSLAYVIYTSGSTGLPKGVEVTRHCVATLLADLEGAGVLAPTVGRVGWNASVSFDASVQQWIRLCRGDGVVMLDEVTRADPALLTKLVVDAELTDLDLTPSHAAPLLEQLAPALAGRHRPFTLLVGGEAIPPSLWRRITELVDDGVVRAVNLYGPTECTVNATAGWITGEHQPHIGTVLPGLELRLLDDDLNPVETGQTGEIYLSGARVARAYRGRPTLTAERFVADVLSADGSRMYRTGDLARLASDGRLEYLGRRDGQVKVRGYRIELGEVEATLGALPDIAQAAVLYRDDYPTGPGLVAYYRPGGPTDVDLLRRHLADVLPDYMVPARFVEVDSFPVTVNGKLDRAALPAPAVADEEGGGGELDGPVEELIAEVWSQVLGSGAPGQISAEDNFFKLGGHSLLAIKLVARVRAEFDIALPVKAVYRHPRLRDLARFIETLLTRSVA